MTDYLKQISKAAADKFCGWKLPQDFYPDCHISFDQEKASTPPHSWPTGTNLLTHAQAQAMFEHCLADALAQQWEPIAWRTEAVKWLRRKADDQQAINDQYPRHVACYPSWESKVRQLNWLADDLEREQESAPFGLDTPIAVAEPAEHPDARSQEFRAGYEKGKAGFMEAVELERKDARKVIEQMVKALEAERPYLGPMPSLTSAAIQAGQQWLEENNGGAG